MGLFSGIGKAIKKLADRKKEKKAGRVAARKAKRDDRRKFKLDKISTRQGAKTERTRLRQEAKVNMESLQSAADVEAYRAGVDPIEHESGGIGDKILSGVGGVVSSIFGGDGDTQASGDSGSIFGTTDDGNLYGGQLPEVTFGGSRQEKKPNYLMWAAIAGGAFLLFNSNSRRRGRR